ncbi:MAG TPA: amidohydrolase family protein [Acidimicrobiia bacterium]|nr:amidohydrolase family protein [Acidimicrobiia bacterium]
MHGSVLTISGSDGVPLSLQVEKDRFTAPAETGIEVDLTKFFALGGLADCHAHLAVDALSQVQRTGDMEGIRRRAFAHLRHGVFLVLDKGWRDEVVLRLLEEPPPTRPHLQAAGRIITGPYGYFEGFAVETDDAGLSAAIASATTTGGWIKLIGDWPQKGKGPVISFGEEALTRACEIAHRAGARVAIHTMAPQTPGQAVRAGVDSIEHGLYLTVDDIALLGGRGGAWVPTIGNVRDVRKMLGWGSSGARVLREGLENVGRMLVAAAEAGVAVLAGTDLGLGHGEVAREAILLKSYGLSDPAAVAAASDSAYRYLGIPFLAPGASADVVLFGGDPNIDVTELQRPAAAMRAGRVVFDHAGAFGR